MLPFQVSEVVVGLHGDILLVGGREPGTRVAWWRDSVVLEVEVPFEPTSLTPVAWIADRAFRVVGRNGQVMHVDESGTTMLGSLLERAAPIAGVLVDHAIGVGPKFMHCTNGAWADATPAALRGDGLSFKERRKLLMRPRLVAAVVDGAVPAVLVDGSVFRWRDGAWDSRTISLELPRFVPAAIDSSGMLFVGVDSTVWRMPQDAEAEVVRDVPSPIVGLAVANDELLVAHESGISAVGHEIDAPAGEGPISGLAGREGRVVCLRDSAAFLRDGDSPWRTITL